MGSSKTIMLAGIYLIFGFYVKSFNSVDETMFKTSMKTATLAQSEQLSQTGLSLAKTYMNNTFSRANFPTRTFVSAKDTVKYSAATSASLPASQTMVTSTASHYTTVTVGGVSEIKVRRIVTTNAVFQYHNGRWKQVRVFTTRDYQDNF
jgi:hypothetical protein